MTLQFFTACYRVIVTLLASQTGVPQKRASEVVDVRMSAVSLSYIKWLVTAVPLICEKLIHLLFFNLRKRELAVRFVLVHSKKAAERQIGLEKGLPSPRSRPPQAERRQRHRPAPSIIMPRGDSGR
jgi:hypothetical protein